MSAEEKLAKALQAERRAQQAEDVGDRKRKYNSLGGAEETVTEEQMEAYRMARPRADDPMAGIMGGEEEEEAGAGRSQHKKKRHHHHHK